MRTSFPTQLLRNETGAKTKNTSREKCVATVSVTLLIHQNCPRSTRSLWKQKTIFFGLSHRNSALMPGPGQDLPLGSSLVGCPEGPPGPSLPLLTQETLSLCPPQDNPADSTSLSNHTAKCLLRFPKDFRDHGLHILAQADENASFFLWAREMLSYNSATDRLWVDKKH